MPELLAGAASLEITPETPQWLDGYASRTRPSEGAYQSIFVKALALEFGGSAALLVSAEVLGFDRARTAPLKRRIAGRSGIPEEAVVLAATHTHCAPRVCDMVIPGEVDPEYLAWFEERCVRVAEQAAARLAPARASVSRAEDRLGVNRRLMTESGIQMRPHPHGPRDRDVDTLWLEDGAGSTIASLTVAACHPTCRGGQQVGGDYPGFLCRELEWAAGGVALFALGCAGDVRPDFRDAEGWFRMAELPEVARAGQEMAAAVLEAREGRIPCPVERLETARALFEVPLAQPPAREELARTAERDTSPLLRLWARRLLAAESWITALPFEAQAIRLLPAVTLLFWPGEVVAEYAIWIKEVTRERTFAAAYANGAVGYVPSSSIYPHGGYEVCGSHPYYGLPAPCSPEVDPILRRATLELLGLAVGPPGEQRSEPGTRTSRRTSDDDGS